jgi:hypothetical protein
MLARCYNEKHHAYQDYGGRGIKVHDSWRPSPTRTPAQAFRQFLFDMGERPSQYYSLDRKKVNEDYSKDNCVWATAKEQGRNKRDTLQIEDPENPGKFIPVAALAERIGVPYQILRYRLRKAGRWPGDANKDEQQQL